MSEDQQQERQTESGSSEGSNHAPLSAEPIDLIVAVSWVVEEAPRKFSPQSFVTSVQLTWDEVLLSFPLREGESKNRTTLMKLFSNALAGRFKAAIQRQGYGRTLRLRGSIEAAAFDHIVNTLEAAGYIQQTAKPRHIKQGRYWMLTERGADRLAILHASSNDQK